MPSRPRPPRRRRSKAARNDQEPPSQAAEAAAPMHVSHLSLADFRSYARAEIELDPGVTVFVGPNGQGKTNLVEAIGYLATLGSHRVASDAPLVRLGTDRAVIRVAVVHGERQQLVELEINPGRAN